MNRGIFTFSAVMVIAGTIGVFVTEANVSTINAVFFRCLLATVVLGGYCWYKKLFNRKWLQSKELRYVIVGGVLLVVNWIMLFQAFAYASITVGIVSYYTAPFFLLFLGVVFLKESTSSRAVVWTGIAFIGLMLITVTGKLSILNNSSMLIGVGFGLAGAFLYGCVTVIGRKIQEFPSALMVFIQMVIGTLCLLPLTDMTEITGGEINWGFLIILGVVHTAFLYILFYRSIRTVPIALIAPLAFIEPVIAILSDVLFYRTPLTTLQMIGIGMILLASYFVSKKDTSPTHRKKPLHKPHHATT